MYSLSDFDDDAIAEFKRVRRPRRGKKKQGMSLGGRTLGGKLARAGVTTAAIGLGSYGLMKGRKSSGAIRINPTPVKPRGLIGPGSPQRRLNPGK